MARPQKCRRVCREPLFLTFAPKGNPHGETVLLTVDEYEALRLIDYEKQTHEQCALVMGISRTTVTDMYENARFKVADSIVNGKRLKIEGGNYRICHGDFEGQCGQKCNMSIKKVLSSKGDNIMRIAVTYENGNIFQHFGHTEQFKFYDVEDGNIVDSQVVDTMGSGHGALAGFLQVNGADTLICGGIGAGAQNALAQGGIKLYGGVSGSADEAVKALISGNLDFNPDVRCSHHDHGEGHQCGEDKQGCGGKGGYTNG